MIYTGDFKFYVDGKRRTLSEVRGLYNDSMTCSVNGLDVFYTTPGKKQPILKTLDNFLKENSKVEKILEEVKNYQKNNGGFVRGIEFPFDTLDKGNNIKSIYEEKGIKYNKGKLPMSILFKQFPDALKAIIECSKYGHSKYKNTDIDWLNFKRINEGSKAYADAGVRHRLENGLDLESNLPHEYHVAWNALAELQLWIEENKQ